jgi:SMI1 / KNR4 family (SUKH-1)
MIRTIQDLKETIISTGASLERQLAGCNQDEIIWLENKYGGSFPNSYKEIISLIGYDAGYLIDDNQCYFFVDQMICLVDGLKECIELDRAEGRDSKLLPDKFWPIYTIYNEEIDFIYLNGGIDCPVYVYSAGDDPEIRIGWHSIWDWMDLVFTESLYNYKASLLHKRRSESIGIRDKYNK